jgi:hypothetical protein
MTKRTSTLTLGLASLAVLGLAAAVVAPVGAVDVGSPGTVGAPATWEQIVQIGSNSKITISSTTTTPSPAIIPAVAGSNNGFGTVATQLSVSTNDASGSSLTLQIANNTTGNSNGTITTLFHTVGTQTAGDVVFAVNSGSSATTLGANTWGYTYVVGASNSVPGYASTFTGVPANGSPNTLLADNNAAGTRDGFVNFGAVVDYSLKAGYTFANEVLYTAAIMP